MSHSFNFSIYKIRENRFNEKCDIFSSTLKDDITYRALPDLDDMLSHPMPTRILRSATPPPNLESMTSGISG